MADHAKRDHATWPASATSRNVGCSGALALAEMLREYGIVDVESDASAWGTACHQVSEKCLRLNVDAVAFLDTVEKTKSHEIEVDEELAETAQTYVDYVRARVALYKKETGQDAQLWIERNFSLAKIKPPFDAGGTADAIIYFPLWRLIEVIDLKGGRGVLVEVLENKQARSYALGTLLNFQGLDIQNIMSTIVQPRIDHKDGRIRSETYHVVDLSEWTADLLASMHKSKEAQVAFSKTVGKLSREAWADKYLNAGDHCTFCPAAGMPCPKQEALVNAKVGLLSPIDDEPATLKNTPDMLNPEQLAETLNAADMIQNFLNACRAFAYQMAEGGVEIPGYVLVDRVGRRKWNAEDDDLRTALYLECDLTDDEIYDRKIKSPAQVEKVLGKKREHLIKDLVIKPVTGKNLVRADKTTRKAVKSTVHQHLTVIED